MLVLVVYSFLTPAAPERQPTHRERATVPRPPHTAALGVAGERTGAAANCGERRLSKEGLADVANNHHPALDSGGQKLGGSV